MAMEIEAMAGDEAIVKRMGEILDSADLSVITTKDIRKQLEEDLGLDLTDKKAFIRAQVDLFMANREEEDAAEGSGENDVECDGMTASESGDEEPDSKRLRAKIKRAMKESLPKTNKRKRGVSGYQKLCQLSPELEAVIGESQAPRTQVVKILWQYIRDRKLQVPTDRRKIQCDAALKKVFLVEQIDMFKMQKKLSKHLFPLDEAAYLDAAERSKVLDAKPELGVEEIVAESGGRASKRVKRDQRNSVKRKERTVEKKKIDKRRTGFAAPVQVSSQLREFLELEESEISRQEVTKKMWQYIKANNLQDPNDKRIILCDEKFNKLFNCEKFSGFGELPRLLKAHYIGKRGVEVEAEAKQEETEQVEEQTEVGEDGEDVPMEENESQQARTVSKTEEEDGPEKDVGSESKQVGTVSKTEGESGNGSVKAEDVPMEESESRQVGTVSKTEEESRNGSGKNEDVKDVAMEESEPKLVKTEAESERSETTS